MRSSGSATQLFSMVGKAEFLCLPFMHAYLTNIEILGVVENEALVSDELLQTLGVEVSVTLVPRNFLRSLLGTLVNLAIKIVETSYSSCLGSQAPI